MASNGSFAAAILNAGRIEEVDEEWPFPKCVRVYHVQIPIARSTQRRPQPRHHRAEGPVSGHGGPPLPAVCPRSPRCWHHGVDLGVGEREPFGKGVRHTVDRLLLPAYKLERRCAGTGCLPPRKSSDKSGKCLWPRKGGSPRANGAFRVRAANKIAAALDNISHALA